jgi:hypothetical protein
MNPLLSTRSNLLDGSNRPLRAAHQPVRGDTGNAQSPSGEPQHGHGWHESSYELKIGVTVVECAWDEIAPQVWSRV